MSRATDRAQFADDEFNDWEGQDERSDDCQLCGGALEVLGSLGRLAHYRCRNCGAQESKERAS